MRIKKTEQFYIALFGEQKKRKYLVIPGCQTLVEWVWVSQKIAGASYIISFVILSIQVRSIILKNLEGDR